MHHSAGKAERGIVPTAAKPGGYKRHSRCQRFVTATGYMTVISLGYMETVVEDPEEDSNDSELFSLKDEPGEL